MAFTKTYEEMLADQQALDAKQYREWLAKEPEREAAREAARRAYFERLNQRSDDLTRIACGVLTADQCMARLEQDYNDEDLDGEGDFHDTFRAVLQAWQNQQKAK